MATLNAKSYELFSASSVFLRASLLPVYTTCIFRCRFTSVKKENKHTHTHTRTATPLCGYAYALCQTKIVQKGRRRGEVQRVQCNLKRKNHTQRGTTRNARREKRTGTVAVESSSSSSAATSTPSSSVPHLLPSSLPPHYSLHPCLFTTLRKFRVT